MVRMSRMPPPSCTGMLVKRRENGVDGCGVHRLAGKSAVEVDDMQIFKALPFENQRLRSGIVIENSRLRHVAMDKANAFALLQVNCRKQDHGRHLKKLEISRRPIVWLFSGWNWTPTTVSRPTMAVKAPP